MPGFVGDTALADDGSPQAQAPDPRHPGADSGSSALEHKVNASPSRPELQAYESATVADARTLVTELRAALGPRLVALLGGVTETKAVHQWADGSRQLDDTAAEPRLRLAYQLLKVITMRDSDGVAQAWFTGLNPTLDDVAPARLVRDGDLEEVGPRLLVAARAFAATGG